MPDNRHIVICVWQMINLRPVSKHVNRMLILFFIWSDSTSNSTVVIWLVNSVRSSNSWAHRYVAIKMNTHLFTTSYTQLVTVEGIFDMFKNPRSPNNWSKTLIIIELLQETLISVNKFKNPHSPLFNQLHCPTRDQT